MSSIKIEREELRVIMQEAMAAGESRAIGSPLAAAASARSGGDMDERGELFAVSVKLADFWSEDPESWFDRADNQFATRGIKEDATKFSHAVQALTYSQHKEVKALIRNPPKGTSYPALKAALISAFGKTQLDKDTELLNLKHLDNRDPRSVAREIDSLLEDPASLPRAVMINLLPQEVRVALATVGGLDTHHKVAEQAWKIINMSKSRSVVSEVRQTCTSCSCKTSQNEPAPVEVDAVGRGRGQGQGRGHSRPEGAARDGGNKKENFVCFSHKKFGTKAYTCKPGCSFAHLPLAQRDAGNGPAGR